ncbi:hypothetical protein Rsub_11927 [Raphidocelis subcapitata]|uniref:RAP domain-containing protein n=1 Tax=Raphidocelis subcapitata TaxID=307507 RepID=A0A2V0PI08_9CHLO|nr:hypothetical protein Rsub_11927 [Raphidocelis subcapitata]|eukprot:GBF99441.1 hypothetical protein Rsub_11927 [Raphidocelis subcapitata]
MATLWPAQQRLCVAVRAQTPHNNGSAGRRRRNGNEPPRPRLGPESNPLRDVEKFQRRLTTTIHHAPTLTALRDIMAQYQGCLNPVHANALMVRAAALVAEGRLGARDMLQLPVLLPGLRDLVLAQLPHYSERCVANSLHSAAVLDMRDRELLGALADAAAAVARSGELTPQGIANVGWAFARLRLPPPPALSAALLAASAAALPRFNPQELADIGWAVAALRLALPPGWGAAWLDATRAALPRAGELGLARLMWAAARMGLAPDDAWLNAAWEAAARRLRSASAHSAASMVWAVCRLWAPTGGPEPAQLEALLARCAATLPQARAADVTVALMGLASCGAPLDGQPAQAAAAVMDRAASLLPSMSVRQVAQLLWAAARLRVPLDSASLARAASKLFYGIGSARANDLAMGLWGLARLGLRTPAAWGGVIFARVDALSRDFKPPEVVALLSALAELRLPPPPSVLAALLGEQRGAEQQLSAYAPRDLSMLALALARLHTVAAAAWSRREQQRLRQAQQRWRAVPAAADAEASDAAGAAQSAAAASGSAAATGPGFVAPAERPALPLAGAPRELREELLRASFHRLGSMSGRDLATLAWAAAELRLDPPPAWLYSFVGACGAALPAMAAPDIAMLVRGLRGVHPGPSLGRVDEFLATALARLGRLEREGGEYTHTRLDALMAMAPPPGSSGSNGGGSNARTRSPSPGRDSETPQLQPDGAQGAAANAAVNGSSGGGGGGRKRRSGQRIGAEGGLAASLDSLDSSSSLNGNGYGSDSGSGSDSELGDGAPRAAPDAAGSAAPLLTAGPA